MSMQNIIQVKGLRVEAARDHLIRAARPDWLPTAWLRAFSPCCNTLPLLLLLLPLLIDGLINRGQANRDITAQRLSITISRRLRQTVRPCVHWPVKFMLPACCCLLPAPCSQLPTPPPPPPAPPAFECTSYASIKCQLFVLLGAPPS